MSESDHESGGDDGTQAPRTRTHKRVLRAVFAADIAGFSRKMSLNETSAVASLSEIRTIGLTELETYQGWLFGMPGDGLFALFENAADAVQCGLEIQRLLSERQHLSDMPMRIGIHLGEVLMDDGLPFGEALNIAARLEALCEPGELLISDPVMDAVSLRVSATFEDRGIPELKNIPHKIPTFAVKQPRARTPANADQAQGLKLDQTTRLDRGALRKILDEQATENGDASGDAADGPQKSPGDGGAMRFPVPTMSGQPAAVPEVELSDECIEQITKALAVHIGPVSKIVVDRYLNDTPLVHDLIAKLATHIPSDDERMTFQARASHISQTFDQTEDE